MKQITDILMSKNFLIGVGVGVAGVYLYNRFMAKEETSNASGDRIGSRSCASTNDTLCANTCSRLGGTFNTSDRNCYKNGVAITGGLFGRSRLLVKR